MCLKGFRELTLQRQQRIERRAGVLEYEPYAAAVHTPQCPRTRADELGRVRTSRSGKDARPGDDCTGGIEESGCAQHCHRLSGSGLADDAECLLALDAQ